MKIFKSLIEFCADDILRLKRFTSPLIGNQVSKKRLQAEDKFLEDIESLESSLFQDDSACEDQDSNYKYFELINRISSDGEESISVKDHEWLKNFVEQQDARWKKGSSK